MICPHGHDEGMHPRTATPEEVDAGAELGEAYDLCPDVATMFARAEEAWVAEHGPAPVGQGWSWSGRERTWTLVNLPGFPVIQPDLDALLGVPDFDEGGDCP